VKSTFEKQKEKEMQHQHWERIYREKDASKVSWYRPHFEQSLAWIDEYVPSLSSAIVDMGAGASTFASDLLSRGYTDLTAVDLSSSALSKARGALGLQGERVRWLVGDVTSFVLEADSVDLWHDRAVFHFLGAPEQRDAYVAHLKRALKPGGYAIVATFAEDGPEKCSGLPVCRYTPGGLAAVFGQEWEKVAEARELHRTPGGAEQAFSYVLLRRRVG
jgi:SAM-dependent methyltransferase